MGDIAGMQLHGPAGPRQAAALCHEQVCSTRSLASKPVLLLESTSGPAWRHRPRIHLHAAHSWTWSRCEGLRRCCLVKAAQATVMMRMISADYVAAPCARVGKLEAGSAAIHHLANVTAAWWYPACASEHVSTSLSLLPKSEGRVPRTARSLSTPLRCASRLWYSMHTVQNSCMAPHSTCFDADPTC